MHRIHKLDKETVSKIAAGEVVERPAMVIKELVENAIDAGASEIQVDVKNGGRSYMRITDDGTGIYHGDLPLLFERHATSKIKTIEDLYRTHSLGFRGEALSSICAVSNVTVVTMQEGDTIGTKVEASAGKIRSQTQVGTVKGTSIWVKDLFFNTPARLKFLKSDQTEGRSISELMSYLALSHPEIAFKYTMDDRIVFHTPGKGKLSDAIFSIYEGELLKHMFELNENLDGIQLKGFASSFDYTKGTKAQQLVFVNGRFVKSDFIKDVVQMAYKPHLMQNRYPVCFLFYEVSPDSIDVNIHPAKTDIKFHEEGKIKQILYTGLKKAFQLYSHVPEVSFKPMVQESYAAIPKPLESKPLESKPFSPKAFDAHRPVSDVKKAMPALEALMQFDTQPQKPELLKPIEEASVYEGLHYVGTFDGTYLIFEKNAEMLMIDQHAAHEKVLYESLMERFENEGFLGQLLLLPEVIELDKLSMMKLDSLRPFLAKLGYAFDAFGESSVVLREIPSVLTVGGARGMFLEILDGVRDAIEVKWDERMASRACKAAIKAHDRLDHLEIDALLLALQGLKSPYTCPHGRPILVKFSKTEIDRKFKRIL